MIDHQRLDAGRSGQTQAAAAASGQAAVPAARPRPAPRATPAEDDDEWEEF